MKTALRCFKCARVNIANDPDAKAEFGRSSGGRHPCTPWGKPTKGYKTRNNKRTDGMIVRRRYQK